MKFHHIRTHKIRDRTYRIIWRAPRRTKEQPKNEYNYGECDWSNRTVNIFPSKNGLELFDTVLEESCHASFFDLDDAAVREFVRDTRRLLTRMGIQISFTGRKFKDDNP